MKKKQKSILHSKEDHTCFMCMELDDDYSYKQNLEEHHVFGGVNRQHSDRFGLVVYLCPYHHRTSAAAVHKNAANMLYIRQLAQKEFEYGYSHEKFMEIFGRNYL